MSIPLPYADQYECRGETLEVYASDRRGQVSYQFNNYGYRNNIDYFKKLFSVRKFFSYLFNKKINKGI